MDEIEETFIPGIDYFTLNDRLFFRVISANFIRVAAKLFLKENGEYKLLETGIYPVEFLEDVLQWDEEDHLIIGEIYDGAEI